MMIPSLFSVSYAGFWGQHRLDVDDFICKAAALGYPAVEIMGKSPHLSPWTQEDAALDALRDHASAHDIQIACIAGYTDFTAGQHAAEVPFTEMQLAYVRQLARVAARLGAPLLRVFTGYATQEQQVMDDWKRCVSAIRDCAAIAQDHGVLLGVQNHHDTAISTEAYGEFLEEVNHPNCRAMYDPWAPALLGEDLYEGAKVMAPYMAQTTLADYRRMKRFSYMPGLINYRPLPDMVRAVPLGDGFLELDRFFEGLKDGGFSGFVAYEMCSPLRGGGGEENLDRVAAISLEKMRALMQ